VSSCGGVLRERDRAVVGRQVRTPMFHRCVKSRRRRRTTQETRLYIDVQPTVHTHRQRHRHRSDRRRSRPATIRRSESAQGLQIYTKAENRSDIQRNLILPAKARGYVLPALVCVSVSLFVTTITKKIVDGFPPNFMGRFLGGKGRPSSCFVTIGRGMWK